MKKRFKVTITAEDKIGREESITLMLEEAIAKRLEKAANINSPTEKPDSYIRRELYVLMDYKQVSPYQCRRLEDFHDLIYHKFYKYDLSIEIN